MEEEGSGSRCSIEFKATRSLVSIQYACICSGVKCVTGWMIKRDCACAAIEAKRVTDCMSETVLTILLYCNLSHCEWAKGPRSGLTPSDSVGRHILQRRTTLHLS